MLSVQLVLIQTTGLGNGHLSMATPTGMPSTGPTCGQPAPTYPMETSEMPHQGGNPYLVRTMEEAQRHAREATSAEQFQHRYEIKHRYFYHVCTKNIDK